MNAVRMPTGSGTSSRASVELRRELTASLVSVAGMVGRPVRAQDASLIGRLADVVVLAGPGHPPVIGFVVRIGERRVWLHAQDVAGVAQGQLIVQRVKFDLVDVTRRPREIQLFGDVVDHQLVDLHGVQVVRASDLYLGDVGDGWRLVGVDTSWRTFLRRALPGPRGWRPTPTRVLDWNGIHTLAVSEEKGIQLDAPNSQLKLLSPADLADLLADLGRSERQELLDDLDAGDAADALELMDDEDVASVLGDATVERAAELLSEMEPDEAVDALREMDEGDREELFAAMTDDDETDLRSLLSFPEDTAGGMMTSALVAVPASGTVWDAVGALIAARGTPDEADAVLLVDDHGALVDVVVALELLGQDITKPLRQLISPPWPVTVEAGAPLRDVVEQMREAEHPYVVVVDDEKRPIGRILADDVVDALADDERRWPWQRLAGGAA